MIVAAGLTPAWQQILRFSDFREGEVNRAVEAAWCASGKVINVGIALAELGAEAQSVALVGGETGEQIRREFALHGRAAQWVATSRATRVCTTILDAQSGRTTELVENAAAVSEAELECFCAAYASAVTQARVAVLTGSLPAGTPGTFYRELLAATPCPVVADFRGKELLLALERGLWLAKPNREELAQTLGCQIADEASLYGAMRQLNDRGAEWVVVTNGVDDVWVTSQNDAYRVTPPRVAVVNPIGCGDCLAAGVAYGKQAGWPPLEAIRFGVAAAVENVGTLLPSRLKLDAVLARAQVIGIQKVN